MGLYPPMKEIYSLSGNTNPIALMGLYPPMKEMYSPMVFFKVFSHLLSIKKTWFNRLILEINNECRKIHITIIFTW